MNAHQASVGPLIIPEVLHAHLEEFQFLCEQFQHALRSPDYRRRDLEPLASRIAAHWDGIVVAGEAAVPLLEAGLAAEEPQGAFAAAYALLRMNAKAGQRVLDAFLLAKAGQLEGICRALCQSTLGTTEDQLRQAVASSPATIAVAAAEVLAFHRKLGPLAKRLDDFLKNDDPEVRRCAWRVTALLGTVATR
ncbi:MAG: hypothetical protein IAF94_00155 [Pirellulaceae bacterium]|nr:hypothetical protein [Pirellulaceae bacterium]